MNESSIEASAQPGAHDATGGRSGGSGALWTFTATTFLSALLLFSIQPMFAKMVLPVLGGASSVWAVALVFFQGALLAGYCYAHLLTGALPARSTGYLHLALCALAFIALPIGLPSGWTEPPPGEPYLWQLGLFSVAVGLPFVAVAANAPLLQAWFTATGHPHGRDPYFLYAASNLGSLLALLGYPFVLEPVFGLKALSTLWTAGFAALVLALALCFLLVRRSSIAMTPAGGAASGDASPARAAAPTWTRRLAWVGLALVPSALLTAFTTHVTTDIASAPLLWVLPLSLYLLTFVLVFRERALIPPRLLLALHLASVIAALVLIAQTKHESWFISSSAGVAVFFSSAMVAHRTLYEARPDARHLTEFYLWMSLGGVLGGLFAALVAPRIFSEVFEYPLLLALSMACRPGALGIARGDKDEWLRLVLLLAVGLLLIYWVPWAAGAVGVTFNDWGATPILAALFAFATLAFFEHPPRQVVTALLMFLVVVLLPSGVKRGEAQRSYYGVYRVMLSDDGDYNVLTHGTTLHGAQRIRDNEGKPLLDALPGTYYHPKSPMALSIATVRAELEARNALGRYGVVGLGAGTLACLSAEGEAWRFFEIDPLIVDIAAASGRFTYINNCQPSRDIVIGDARLTLAREENASLDLLIVDAFTSDAVPVHLMTAEAIALYLDKLKPDGALVLHVSNRYLALETVLAATIKLVEGADGLIVSDEEADGSYAATTSTIVVVSRSPSTLAAFRKLDGVSDLNAHGLHAWTDDTSDVLGPFLDKMRRR